MQKTTLTSLIAAIFLLPVLLAADSLKPSWQCLPSETALGIRIPDGVGFLSEMRGTLLGSHLLSEERINEAIEILQAELGEDWRAFQRKLGEFGLEPDELPNIFRGESGLALVLNPSGEGDFSDIRLFALFWMNPGEELGERVLAGLLAAVEESEAEHPPVRVDFSLAGRDIVHLAAPQTARAPDGSQVVTHNAHNLLTRIDGRILGALTLFSGPDSMEVYQAFEDEGGIPEPDPEPSEELLGLFARFLQGHEGEDGGFYRSLRSTSGMDESLPAGTAGLEIALNPEPLFGILSASDDPDIERMAEAFGFLDLGMMAFRGAMLDKVMRWGGMMSAPSPRRGVVETLLDQQELQPRPPAWVPSGVVDYTHFSLDFGELYTRIRQVVTDVAGEEAAQGFAMMEMQVEGLTGEGVAATLSSLGHQHSLVILPSEAAIDFTSDSFADNFFSDRIAFVWAPRNEQVWQRIMQSIGMFAPMMGGALQQAEEQGFTGWRMDAEGFEGGLFLGQGFLVLGMGAGTLEEILAGLRSPPEGEHSLAGSELYRNARALIDSRPGLHWEIQDSGRQMGDLARTFKALLEAATQDSAGSPSDETIEWLNRILDPDAFEEAFGAGVSQTFVTRDGLVMESAQELTPSE